MHEHHVVSKITLKPVSSGKDAQGTMTKASYNSMFSCFVLPKEKERRMNRERRKKRYREGWRKEKRKGFKSSYGCI